MNQQDAHGARHARNSLGDLMDRLQVGSWFGLVAGVVAFAVVLLWAGARALLGKPSTVVSPLHVHALYVFLYLLDGAVIGALWPLRRSPLGHWCLRALAAAAPMLTLISLRRGSMLAWSPTDWLWLVVSASAFAWVFGSAKRTPV